MELGNRLIMANSSAVCCCYFCRSLNYQLINYYVITLGLVILVLYGTCCVVVLVQSLPNNPNAHDQTFQQETSN